MSNLEDHEIVREIARIMCEGYGDAVVLEVDLSVARKVWEGLKERGVAPLSSVSAIIAAAGGSVIVTPELWLDPPKVDPGAAALGLGAVLVAAGVPDLIGERDRLAAQVTAVEALHRPSAQFYTHEPENGGRPYCTQCSDTLHPCPTIRALHPDDYTED